MVEFYVNEHNTKMPHPAFSGQTPDEMFFLTGAKVPKNWRWRRAMRGQHAWPPTARCRASAVSGSKPPSWRDNSSLISIAPLLRTRSSECLRSQQGAKQCVLWCFATMRDARSCMRDVPHSQQRSSFRRCPPFSGRSLSLRRTRPDGSQDGAGAFSITVRSTNAGPSGVRRPCSQLRTVLTLTRMPSQTPPGTAQVSLSWPPRRHRVLGPYGRGHVPSRLA